MIARTYKSLAVVCAFVCTTTACREQDAQAQATPQDAAPAQVAPYQTDLLELAFRGVSKFPDTPHLKNRCRAQEAVVQACIRLGQEAMAARFAGEISNWQRGTSFASLAIHCAERGDAEAARRYAAQAEKIVERGESLSGGQKWRVDRVRARLARCYALLGEDAAAKRAARGADPKQLGPLRGLDARKKASEDFDQALAVLDGELASGDFEIVRSALGACVEVYEHSAKSAAQRQAVATRVHEAYQGLPGDLRIAYLCALAEADLRRGAQGAARSHLEPARSLSRALALRAESAVPLRARLGELFFKAGRPQVAEEEFDSAEKLYRKGEDSLPDVFRAETLRPLAVAYAACGFRDRALKTYKRVAAVGALNPNSRPRAIDLAETCCSLAEQGCEPDAELWAHLRKLESQLGDPW